MKFLASFGVTVLMALVIGWGMVRLSHDKPLFFFIALGIFVLMFSFIGCLPPKKQH